MRERVNIAICDDQREVAEELRNDIIGILNEKKCDCKTVVFCAGKELLASTEKFDIVFLDIEMPEMDGIETGKILRQKNDDCKIVMATGIERRYKEAFQIQAFRYITKPFQHKEIEEALEAAVKTDFGEQTIELFRDRNAYAIKCKEIQYVKAFNGYTEFLVGNQTFRKEVSLSKIEAMLEPKMFFRIHRQYIINMHWIQDYTDGCLVVADKRFQISRRKRKEFEQRYMEFDLKYR